jgi:hypothetical protein
MPIERFRLRLVIEMDRPSQRRRIGHQRVRPARRLSRQVPLHRPQRLTEWVQARAADSREYFVKGTFRPHFSHAPRIEALCDSQGAWNRVQFNPPVSDTPERDARFAG